MRVNDLKSILWWLSGGLLVCIGVLAAVVFFLEPSRSHARAYGLHGERQMARARQANRDCPTAGQELETTYGSTFDVKIDGIPRRPGPRPGRTDDPPAPRDFKLADLIDVVGVWTDAVFYRVKSNATRVEEVEVGEAIPARLLPELEGTASLVRIESRSSPFLVVFDVNGAKEEFRVPWDAVVLGRADALPAAEEYRGPGGPVSPAVRSVPPAGVRVDPEDGSVVIGAGAVSDPAKLFEGVAWDVAPNGGIVVVKIPPDSRAGRLNAAVGGLLEERDVIVSVGGVKVKSKAQLINHFKQHAVPAGSKLALVIRRKGRIITRTIVLAGR